jgi:hypothetical protein
MTSTSSGRRACRPRLTIEQVRESERLRQLALSTGWTYAELAKVCQCHPDTIKQWLGERQLLSPERQALLKQHYQPAS